MEAARAVAKLGFVNVKIYPEGMPGWKKNGNKLDKLENALPEVSLPVVSSKVLKVILNTVTILDIRTPELYKSGMISGGYNIPLAHLTKRVGEIPRDRPIVVTDHMGKQVDIAGRYLKSMGFEDVRIYEEGFIKWRVGGNPVVMPETASASEQ